MRALLTLVPLVAIGCNGTSGGPGKGGAADLANGGAVDGAAADGGSQPTSAVTLQNAMAQIVDASSFYVSFVIDNTKAATTPITRVDIVSVAWRGNTKVTGMPACTQAPWIAPGEQTGALTLYVFGSSNGTDLSWDCGGLRASHDPAYLLLPFSGAQVTVGVDGITCDSAPFTATVTTRAQ